MSDIEAMKAEIHKIICPDVKTLRGMDCQNCWTVCKEPCEIKTTAILALIASEQEPMVEALKAIARTSHLSGDIEEDCPKCIADAVLKEVNHD